MTNALTPPAPLFRTINGRYVQAGPTDPAARETLREAWEAYWTAVEAADTRTPAQRQADARAVMARW